MVSFLDFGPTPANRVTSGSPVELQASIDLGGLEPGDVRVEAVVGRVGISGQLEDTQVMSLPPVEQNGQLWRFASEFVPHQTGRLGFALRVSPNHFDDPLTRPCYAMLKWA